MIATEQARFTAITLALVGLALERAATQGRRQAAQRRKIGDVTAGNILSGKYNSISPQLSVKQLVQDYFRIEVQPYFMVTDNERLEGIITLNDVKSIPKKKWGSKMVGAIMTPASRIKTAYINQPGDSLLEQMDKWDLKQMPVLDDNKLIGIVARDDLIRLSQSRIELKR